MVSVPAELTAELFYICRQGWPTICCVPNASVLYLRFCQPLFLLPPRLEEEGRVEGGGGAVGRQRWALTFILLPEASGSVGLMMGQPCSLINLNIYCFSIEVSDNHGTKVYQVGVDYREWLSACVPSRAIPGPSDIRWGRPNATPLV